VAAIRARGGRPFALRIVIAAATWIVVTTGSLHSPVLAAIVILASALASLTAIPPGSVRLSPVGIVRFLPLFIAYSARGGFDVARLAFFRPQVPAAGTLTFVTTLNDEVARYFFVAVIGSFPGSLVIAVDGQRITIHALDRGTDVAGRLRVLERRVAVMFGEAPGSP